MEVIITLTKTVDNASSADTYIDNVKSKLAELGPLGIKMQSSTKDTKARVEVDDLVE